MSGAGVERIASKEISLLRAGLEGGLPLVLLHGIGSNAQSFTALMEVLAPSRPVLAWDAPGYGASAPLPMEWPSPSDYAGALERLLDRLGIGQIDLLGHSMGALVAGRFARLHPQRVKRLILGSPALGYGTKPGEPLAPAAASRLNAMIEEGPERFAAARGPRLLFRRHDSTLVAGAVKAMSEVRLPGYEQASRMLSTADLIGEAAHIARPTLVLVGAEDEITPPANCRRLYDALASAHPDGGHRFATIPDAGHAAPQERPKEISAIIASFAPATSGEG